MNEEHAQDNFFFSHSPSQGNVSMRRWNSSSIKHWKRHEKVQPSMCEEHVARGNEGRHIGYILGRAGASIIGRYIRKKDRQTER